MVLKFFLLIIFITPLWAKDDAFGEKKIQDYYGPVDPIFKNNFYRNEMQFIDDILKKNYVYKDISHQIDSLERFFIDEFSIGAMCPDFTYERYKNYIRYLYRIQGLSYLFQSLREHEYLAKKFQFESSCSINWTQQMDQCEPQTPEMVTFKRDAKIALANLTSIKVPFSKSSKSEYEKWLKTLDSTQAISLTQARLQQSCQEKCKLNEKSKIEKYLTQVCDEEKRAFELLCNEKDELYGASYVPEMYHLIANSHGIKGIDAEGYGSGCLRRYTEQNKSSEKVILALQKIFTILYDYNLAVSPSVPQGRLFNIGSIKEFTDKGLASMFEPKKETDLIVTETQVSQPVVALVNPEFEKIELPKFIKSKVIKTESKKTEVKKEKNIIKRSSFYLTSEFRERYKLDKVEVDLTRFKYDYVFTLSQIQILSPKIAKFSEIKTLKDLKTLDKLGTEKSPVPLRFIKFLIERKDHQSLYNIIQILGDDFYIYNDIDQGTRKADRIYLQNDESTKFDWKLFILKA